jgi:hypothetical protein
MAVKKYKTADGTPADAAIAVEGDTTVGIADDLIRQHDTVLVPITQFEFSEADIINKFGGNHDFLLQGAVTSVHRRYN